MMPSIKQIEANRQNAKKSTGPRTSHGKLRTRQNAFRHGLTAETVITVLENATEYDAFEADLVAEYRPTNSIEHMLVLRLSSLLWRLRRAATIETGLFAAQGRMIKQRRRPQMTAAAVDGSFHASPGLSPERPDEANLPDRIAVRNNVAPPSDPQFVSQPHHNIAECFFRLATEQPDILERIQKYEASLWKQAIQVIALLSGRTN